MSLSEFVVERIRKLGLTCDDEVPSDGFVSATAALASFPMYMVSNVHAWTGDSQFEVLGIAGTEAALEAYAIGQEEAGLGVEKVHRKVLTAFLRSSRPADKIVYDFAVETLRLLLEEATPAFASAVRQAVARSMLHVASASGEGIFGTGEKISVNERAVLAEVSDALDLNTDPKAAKILEPADIEVLDEP